MRRRWYEHTKYEPNPVLIVVAAVVLTALIGTAIGIVAWSLRLFP